MRIFFAFLLSVIGMLQLRAETEREFFSHLVDSLPKAAPGEFKTPESVARYFVQAIIDNHVQDTFRCVPLSRMYAVDTFENTEKYIGDSYNARDGLPDDNFLRYQKLLIYNDYMPVQKIRIGLLLAIDSSKTNLLERLQKPESKDPAVVNKWLEKLSNDLSFRNLTNAIISSVTAEKPETTEWKYLGILPFQDLHKVTVHISVRGSDNPVEFGVGMLDGNWQIHALLSWPTGP